MGLSHPDETCILTDFKIFSPELLDKIQLDLAKNVTIEVLILVQTGIDFPLEGCFQEVGHHVVEVGAANQLTDEIGLEARVLILFEQGVTGQDFIGSGWCLDKVERWFVVKDALFLGQLEMSCVSQLVSQYQDFIHEAGPGKEDVGRSIIKSSTVATSCLAFVLGKVNPALIKGLFNHPHIVLAQDPQAVHEKLLGFFWRNPLVEVRRQANFQIGMSNLFQAVSFGHEFDKTTHVGSQLFHNDINLTVKEVAGNILLKKEIVNSRVEAPKFGLNLLIFDLG